jgi:signal transduction histidine kinase
MVNPTRSWVVVLGCGGEVLGAEHGAPPEWIGATLHDRPGVPAALRDAARALTLLVLRGGTLARARVDVPELDASVELVAVPAVGLHRTPTDVRALLPYSVAALERQARALDVGLSVTIDPDVPAALVLDPEKIAWAVSALAGNAMRYVRRGTRHMPGGSIAVTASRDAERGELLLVVEDDGPGIPAQVVERMFQRAPGAPHATGLALTVVRDIVTAHGGSMELATSTDEADHGTTVTVRIPI